MILHWRSIIFLLFFLLNGFPVLSQTYQIDLNDGDTIATCTGTFYDSGGAGGNYGNNEDYTVTFCSDNGGTMGLDFTTFEVRDGDTLFIYDGPSTGSLLIGAYSGEGISFQVASTDTAITLNFKSNGIFNRAGWEATIECDLCIPPLTTPIFPADNIVCAGEIINYSVDDHPGSTYTWTIANGTPASVVDGPNNIDVTWSLTGGISGSVKVVEENSCGAKDSSFLALDIYDLPVVSFSGLASDYCMDDSPVTLTGNPVGGTFSGPGITGNQFDPVAAGLGIHTITYTYTDAEGCTDSDIQNTTVHVLPLVSFSGLSSLYDINDGIVTLTGSPSGGTFTGNGIVGNTFSPGLAGVGIHTIIYSYTDAFGCSGTDTHNTEVRDYNFRAGARVLTDIDNWCSADGAYSTVGATGDQLRGSCWANGPNYNRWFTFQATKSYVTVELKVGGDDGTMQYPFLAVWDAANTQLGCASYTSQYSDIQASVTGLTVGTWYYISVDNFVGAGYRGTFTLCVDDTVSNDFKLGAYEISNTNNWCSGDGAYTTLYGTPDGVRPGCWSNGPNYNVWFKFQATTTGITIDLKTGGSEGTIQYPFIALWDEPGTILACVSYSSQYSDLTLGSSSLTPGQWYYVSVDNYVGAGYRGTFKLCFSDVVDYDFKAGAIELTDLNNWCSADAAYTTMNASADGNRGSCWNTGPNFTRWFRFQATTTEILVQLKTGGAEGTLQYPYLSLLDTNNNELACARYSAQYSDLSVGNSSLIPGDWYYILVDNYNDVGYRGSFSLCVSDDIDYDFKAGAIELADLNNWCSAEAAYTTLNASPDGIRGSCWNTGPTFDRWFMFQATTSEVLIQLKTGGSEGTLQYPYIALWDTMNVEVACARYFAQYSDLTIGASNLTPGEWYFITVDNYADVGYRGSFTLCISDEIDYNFKAGAFELSDLNNWCSADAAYTTINASPDGTRGSCWNTGPNYDRWFTFTATTSDILIQLKTGGAEGTIQYPYIALWDSLGVEEACARYFGQYSDLTIGATDLIPGDRYYITVDNYAADGYRGTFTLCVTDNIDYNFKEGAIELTDLNNWCSADAAYTTLNASSDGPKGSCWNTGSSYDRWFLFQATTTQVTIDIKTGGAEGTLQYPYIALWDTLNNQKACAMYSSQYSDLRIGATNLTPGEWYYITVDNYAADGYRGSFTLCINDQIDYDFKAGALEILPYADYCSAEAEFTTINATDDGIRGSCWNTGPNNNRWFRFQATGTDVTVWLKTGGTEGTLQYPYIALWDAADVQLACSRYSVQYSDLELVYTSLTPGNWYYITVDNYTGSGYRGSFTLCTDDEISYDFVAGAIELSDLNGWCSAYSAYSTMNATADQAKGSCWDTGPNYNRWFKFQAPSSDIAIQVRITGVEGSLVRPYVALWNIALGEVSCKRYYSDNGDIEVASTGLTPGQWYYISVDNFNNAALRGTFTLCITSAHPNDNMANAIEITDLNGWCSEAARFSNIIATADQSQGSCWSGATNKNVWFKFQATSANVTISVKTGSNDGEMRNQQVALWTAGVAEIGCNTLVGSGTLTLLAGSLTIGNWYYISVDDDSQSGTFTLCVDDDLVYPFPSGAVELTDISDWCSPDAVYTNVPQPNDTKNGTCWLGTPYKNKWFKFQATTSQINVQVKTGGVFGTMQRQQVALFNSTGAQVSCALYVYNQGTVIMQSDALTPGQWYWFAVDDNLVNGTFSLCVDDQVDYNYRASAIELTDLNNWCSGDGIYSNLFATGDGSQGSCWTGAVNKNVWFKFVATNPFIKISVSTGSVYGNMERQQVSLWNAAGVQVACAKWVYNQGTITLQTDTLFTGHTYYISVDDDLTSGTFSLCADNNISYDYQAGAILLTNLNNWCSADAVYDNLYATDDENLGSCWSGTINKNVWFRFQANTSFIKIQVRTGSVYGSMQRQQVSVWNEAGVEVACARWVYNQGTVSLQTDTLTIGHTYYISVDDDLVSGSFSICADENIDYDYKAGAILLANLNNWCSADAVYDNLFATDDEDLGSCWSGTVNKNVWFMFQASTSFIKVRVKTGSVYGSMQRQQVSVWNEAGIEVACARWVTNQGTISLQTDTLTIGHMYYISVDDDLVSGSFSLCADENIDYDYEAGAMLLTNLNNWCSGDAVYDNIFATNDGNMGSCWSGTVNKNVWFKFQAQTRFIKVLVKTGSVYGSMQRQQVALWNVTGDEVACARWVTNQGTVTMQADSLTTGNWYYISIDDDLVSGSFSLCIDRDPDYDYLEGAVVLTNLNNWCSSDAQYSNAMATDDRDMGSCWSGTVNKNVWFTFQAPGSFIRAVVKTGSVYGTMQRQQLALWNTAGDEVACARWITNQGTVTLQIDTLTAGNWYWISVDDDNVSGSFSLCIDQNLDYDYKAGAVLLTNLNNWCSTDAQFSNIVATADQNMGSCWGGAVNKNVWFTFQAIKSHFEVKIRTGSVYGTMQRQQAAIWNASGTQLACGALGTATGDLIITVDTLTIGKWYWISVDDNQTSGSFSICVKGDPLYVDVTGTNITCFGFNNGTALASAGGGTPPYTYSWSGPGSFSSTLPAISGLVPGLYTVIVRDALLKTATDQITILEPAALSITTDLLTHVSCSGIPEGSIEITPSGGTTPYSYAWTGPGSYSSTDQDIFNLIEGNYSLALTDANSCTFNYNATILVLDITPPTAICQNLTVYLNGAGTATITTLQIDNGSSDACGIDTMYLNDYSFTCADIGNNVVILTVRDVNGNSNTCNSTVTVQDTVHPVAICKDITVQLNPAGVAVITPADVDNGSNDACGIALMTLDQTVFTCTEIGLNTVTLTVTDNNGNTDTCQSTVTVEDNIAPTALCNDLTIQLNASGNASITPSDIDAGSTDACGIALLQLDKTDFTCSDVGVNVITLTVTDNNGNVSICTADVTVEDNIPPVAACNNITTQLDATGNSTILPADINNGSSDACGIFNLSLDITDFTCADIGPNVVILTVTDVNGNSSTCNSIVTVSDTISPIANCQDINAYLDATGNVTIAAADINNGSIDACGIASMVLDITDFSCADIGANAVTLTVTDNNGNTDQCTATVTVIDTISPVAVCQDINAYLDATGIVTIAAADINNGSTDACGIASMVLDITDFNCTDIGANTVTLTVTDNNGNTDQCTATVTVIDTISPIAVCQDINAYLDATGNVTIAAADINNGSSDACGIASMVLDVTDFTCADIGPNTVTLTVTDNNGNTDQCTATVTVIDTISPVAVCQDINAYLDATGNVTIAAADVNNGSSDACGIAGMVLDITDFTCADIGANTVSLTVTDNNGNTDQCTATVTVIDTISPVAVCQDINAYLDATGNVTIAAASVNNGSSDACGIASMELDITDFTCADIGGNTVTLTVTDNNGNTDQCTATVTVIDTISPVAVCQDINAYLDATGNVTIAAADVNNGSSDACGIASMVLDITDFTCSDVGGNTVTLTVTDNNGNTDQCTATVTIIDTISPVAICQDINAYLDVTGNVTIVASDIDDGSNDACGIAGMVLDITDFTCADIGGNTVTLTVTDNNGNTDQCTATVTVIDTISPVAVCQDINAYLDVTGNVTIAAADVNNGSSDACGIASMVLDITDFTCSDVGGNTVTLTVTDNNGNTDQCTATVTVIDTISPVAVCQDINAYLDATGNVTIAAADVNNGSSDACGIASMVLDITDFNCTDIGANTVTLTVTDNNGNTDQCTATVTVIDTISPVAVCQDINAYLDATGNVTIAAASVNNGSSDACGIASMVLDITDFTCSNVGGNTVTLTVTDNNGNTDQCTATVTVIDTISPVAVCQDINAYLDATGNVTIAAADINNGSSDACGIASMVLDITDFNCTDIGANTVTLTVTDNNGNTDQCTATVTVIDTISPIAVCQDINAYLDATGNVTIAAADVNNGSSDACGIASMVLDITDFNCTDIGANTVTLTVTDNNGNTDQCTATVTVIDTISPVAVCQDINAYLDATGNITIAAADINNGSSDACGIASMVLDITDFNCTDIGANAVTLTVTDNNGNTDQCTATVTVIDTISPVAACQDINAYLDATGNLTIAAADVNNGSSDACGIASMTLDITDFNCSDIGANTVTLTVTDNNGNTDQCTATVTVIDTISPVAVCQDINAYLDATGNVTIAAADVNNGSIDACGIASMVLDITDFNCSDIGANTVTLTVTDNNGNTDQCTATVTVIDTISPVAVCQDITVQLDATGNVTITGADVNNGSSDACGIASLTVLPNSFTCANVGPNNVTLTVTDNNGNSSTCNAVVTVEDNVPPAAVCQDINAYLDATGNVTIVAADINNGSSDACGIASMVLDITDFNCTDIGANTVTLTVTDNNGNTDQCTATVTVIDTISPIAVCQDINAYLDATGNVTIAAADINNGSSDACGIASMVLDVTDFTCADIGPNTVTLTVTDNNGNTDQCTATVTVIDTISPVAVCQDINAYLDATGNITIAAADINNGSTDACGIASMVLDITDFSCADIGANTVTLTVTDNNGNTDQCTATVTVIDTISPVAVCQDINAYLDATGNVTIAAADVNNGSSDACGIASMVLDITDFSCADIGANAVTLTVTDNNGNTHQCTATVTVIDTISPVAVCQDINAYLDATGIVTIAAADINNGSTDACGIASMVLDITDFSCADIGANTVILTVTDNNGNTDQCQAIVTVIDTISPVAVCQDINAYLDATGNVTIAPADINNGSSDACGIASLTVLPNSFTCANVGPNNVTLTVTDNNGNTSTCNAVVTVEDNIPPVAVCQDITVQLDATGNVTITGADVNNGSSDACGIASLTVLPNSFTCANVGPNNVTLTVTDNNGNTSTCNAVVTVEDNVPPVAVCQDINIPLDASGHVSITTADINNGSNDACGIDTMYLDFYDFDCTNAGPNIVTLNVEDLNGNISICSATVIVQEIEPPVPVCTDTIVYLDYSGTILIDSSFINNASTDNCEIISIIPSQTVFGCSDIGPNNVLMTVTDRYGNSASCNAVVTVLDTIAPIALCNDTVVYLDVTGNAVIDSSFVAGNSTDACGIQSIKLNQFTFDCNNIGQNAITITVTDINGNSSECMSFVTVMDTIPPAAICQNIDLYLDETGTITISAAIIDNSSSDECGIDTMYLDKYTFSCEDAGVNNVLFTVEDMNGNSSICVATINILDTLSPAVVCPSEIIMTTNPGECSISITGIAPQTTDNCSVESIEYTLTGASTGSGLNDASGELFNEGMTTVTYKLYDAAGNADSCSFNVTVIVTSVPPDTASSDRDSICPGDGNITLSYSGGAMPEGGEAQWYGEPSFTNNIGSGNDLVIPAPLVTSMYYVRFEGNCDTTTEKAVTVYAKDMSVAPVSANSDRDSICSGDGSIMLIYAGGSAGAGASAQWYSDPLCTQWVGSGNNLAIVAPLVTTDYYVRFEGECDTTDVVMSTIYVHPVPQPKFIIQSDRLCMDAGDVLYVADGFVGSGFTWSITGGVITADRGDSIFIDWGSQVGDYQLTMTETTLNGCISAPVILNVQLTSPTVELGADQFICDGDIAAITPMGTFASVLWHDGSSGSTYTTDVSEMVRVTVYDENLCVVIDSVQVTVTGTPYVNIGNDTLLCGEQSLVLGAGNPGSVYEWSTGETSQAITVFKGAQEIWVFVTTEYGCSGGDTIMIYRCSVTDFFDKIPNAFTPNEDNVNDTWYFDEAAAFPNIRIEIFDRWGKLVFRSEIGYPEPWDGKSMNGKEMPMDSYFYVIDPGDGSDQIEGTVTIIR